MDNKAILKKLIEKTLNGDFEHVYKHIGTNKIPIDENVAIRFIVACCNACNNNIRTPEKLNENDLVDLVKCLLSFIKKPLTEQCECYLQSVFFISKLLIEKRSFECVLQLKEMFLPEFLPQIFKQKQYTVYLNICKSMYNVIVKIATNQEKKYRSLVLQMCYLLAAMYKKTHEVTKLIDSVYNCVISLVTLDVTAGEIQEFYCHFLSMIDYEQNPQFWDPLVHNFSFVYTYLLKNGQFDIATDCFDATLQKLKTLFTRKDYAELYQVIEIAKWMNPKKFDSVSLEVPNKAHSALKNYYKKYQSTTNLQAPCDFISSVCVAILQHYKSNPEEWLQKPQEVRSALYSFLFDVSQILSKTPYQCPNCPTKTNLNEALGTLNSTAGLARLAITTTPRNCKLDILKYFDKYLEYVTTLKTNKCPKWRNYWYDAGVHLYALGFTLLKNHDLELSIQFLKKFVRSFLEFEGLSPQIIEKTYLIGALGAIADACSDSKDYERCLFATALSIILSDAPKNEINRWIKTKLACRESTVLENWEIQELTLVSVCQKFEDEMLYYDPKKQFGIDRQKQIELLIYELKNYKMKWKSKVPMMAAFKELSQIADSALLGETFIEIWGDCSLQVHENLPKLLQNTIKRLEVDTKDRRSVRVKFNLAYLYFLQHKYRVKDTIIKHCDEMEKTMMNMTKITNDNDPIPPDPNEECDVISSYDCLNLSKYLHMMKELNKSLEILHEIFANNNLEKLGERDKLFGLLSKMGHECKLHNHSTNSLQAWELALKLAHFENNSLYTLQATSFIIEMSDVTKPSVEKLVAEGQEITSLFLSEQANLEDSIMFLLCKSEAYFFVDFDVAYEAFRKVLEVHRDFPGDDIMKARILCLHHRFIMLPCRFEVEGHREFSLVKIHLANNHAVRHYTENISDSAYHMRIFFEVNETLVRMYHDLRLPREVRCYCKEVLMIAQKLVLPFRTMTCLYYLTHADISSCRLDDCRVKISGLSDILNLSKFKIVVKDQICKPEEAKFDKTVDHLVSEFSEMMLDVPAKKSRPTCTGSPTFKVETFNVPAFLNHEDICECFYCTCVEYHQFVLRKTFLHALFYEHNSNTDVAKEFFCGCIKIYEYFKSKQDVYLKKVAKKLSVDLIPTPQTAFIETYCLILFEYGNFSLRSGKVKNADKINKRIIQTLESFSLQYIYLYNEVLSQRLNILSEKVLQKSSKTLKSPCEQLNVATIEKTPESKHNPVVISPDRRSQYMDLPKLKPKNLRFNLSDDDDEEENAKAKKSPISKCSVPSFISAAARTPAPSSSKIKIYTNKSTKKKKVLADIPPPKNESNEFVVPMSPEAYTPSSKKVDSVLINRTRLLTSRLKKNSENVPSIVVSDDNEDSRPAKGVRQNLLSQLEGSEASTPSAVKGVDSSLVSRTKLLTSRLKSSARNNGEHVPSATISDGNSEEEGARKASVRQNLLLQMEGSVDGEDKGVRRSARNKNRK